MASCRFKSSKVKKKIAAKVRIKSDQRLYLPFVSFRNVQSVWTEDHALAWHLEEKFRQDSAGWALDKCLAWDKLEDEKLADFLSEIIDCPCTLAQARADTGRFHVSVKRSIFRICRVNDSKLGQNCSEMR